MKKLHLTATLALLLFVTGIKAQVGIGTPTPAASAMLDISSTNKGILLPRVALTGTGDKTTIASPQTSLLVYNSATAGSGTMAVTPGFYYWNGSAWERLTVTGSLSAGTWALKGNAGTDSAFNFIGTTDAQPLLFKVNNQLAGKLSATNFNTSWGYGALAKNTGNLNTAVGKNALNKNTTGTANTANGAFALNYNTTGNNNTAVGDSALYKNTKGSNNTASGRNALAFNITGDENTASGNAALYSNTYGAYNTANGYAALYSNTIGLANTANGDLALYNNTTGSENTANGMNTLEFNTVGENNTANGYSALNRNTIGNNNTADGVNALYLNTTGDNSTANGMDALHYNTTGYNNTANGYQALYSNTTGSDNTGSGLGALYKNTTGSYNTANGENALYSNSTGSYNAASGRNALYFNTIGNSNTANGLNALYNNTSGDNNTALGTDALRANITGSNNTAFGNGADVTSDKLTNATAIGANTKVDSSNCLVLGNDANVGIGTSKPANKLTVTGDNSSFLASFENTNAEEGDGIQIKLGRTHPALSDTGYLNIPNPIATLYASPGLQIKDWVVNHAAFNWKQLFTLYPNSLLVGTGFKMANVAIDQINAHKPLLRTEPKHVSDAKTIFNGVTIDLYLVPDVTIPKLVVPAVDIPPLSLPFPDLKELPDFIPDDATNMIPNISFNNANSNSLSNKNQFISFKDKDNRELGSIRAESVTDWENNYLSSDFFTKFMMSLVGLDFVSSISWAGSYFTDITSSYNNLGVEYVSGHGDYAEWLAREDSSELITQGDIVGVKGGKITRDLINAEQVRVVSSNPIMLGNAPEKTKEQEGNKIAFMGQVPVKVMGPVYSGDYIVAKTDLPGYGTAVSEKNLTVADLKLAVGRSWETNTNSGAKMVNTLVGIDKADYVKVLEGMERQVNLLEDKFNQLSTQLQHPEGKKHSRK